MNDKDNLTLAELEMLAQAYLDCKLSRLQEKELEYVLMSCGLSSPLIDEVRECMALSPQESLPRKNAILSVGWLPRAWAQLPSLPLPDCLTVKSLLTIIYA